MSFLGVDACAEGHNCQHICFNNGISYGCKCHAGFVLNPDKTTCSRKIHYMLFLIRFFSVSLCHWISCVCLNLLKTIWLFVELKLLQVKSWIHKPLNLTWRICFIFWWPLHTISHHSCFGLPEIDLGWAKIKWAGHNKGLDFSRWSLIVFQFLQFCVDVKCLCKD